MAWLSLIIAIVAEVIATSALKASNGFTQLWPSVVTVGLLRVVLLLVADHAPHAHRRDIRHLVGHGHRVGVGSGMDILQTTLGFARHHRHGFHSRRRGGDTAVF